MAEEAKRRQEMEEKMPDTRKCLETPTTRKGKVIKEHPLHERVKKQKIKHNRSSKNQSLF